MTPSQFLRRASVLAVCAIGATTAVASAAPMPATHAPQNPFMARNPDSNIHNDTWMTDAYQRSGPLGRNLQTKTGAHAPSLCGSLAFDKAGRILSVCPSMFAPPQARVFDPKTLKVIATYDLPDAPNPPGTKFFQNFTGGGYFFLDGKDRLWSATKTSHLFVLAQRDNGRKLVKVADYDLSKVLKDDERITSALPDWKGRIWFVSKKNGVIGVLDTHTRKIQSIRLNEEVENSFAVDRDAVYIASDKRMYRFHAGTDNKPVVDWKHTYRNSGIQKPSQLNAGTGTTPTITDGGYVAITDNADPMNVVVYRKAAKLAKGTKRVVCETPVFKKGASATENSIIAAGRSLFVENNYGYQDPFGPNAGAQTTPGFARVDINKDGSGCKVRWTNKTAPVPTVVSKLSTKTGLIYTYIAPEHGDGPQTWYWAAIDAKTGKEVWRKAAGTGPTFNNNYSGLSLGPDGTAYVGTFGGLQALRDK
jgi:outer membrane protein assembly factor BamB